MDKNKNWLRFDVLFLIGYTIVHFQIPFLASLNIEPAYPSYIWINKQLVNFATWMSMVAITTWMLGYTIIKNNKFIKKQNDKSRVFKINFRIYDNILLCFLILFLAMVGSSFLSGVYDGGRSYGEGASYIQNFLKILLYLRIIYFFNTIPKNTAVKQIWGSALLNPVFLFVLVIYVLLYLRAGDRGPIMQVALTIAGSYTLFVRRIPFYKIILFVVIGSFVFTILRFGRSREADVFKDENIIERGISNLKDNEDQTNFTDELASSVRIQYRALDIVPEEHPYLYGTSFFAMTVGSIIPFSSEFILKPLGIPYWYWASSTFLNVLVKGHGYDSGDGSEILADIYVNFGLYGVFILMFLFGMYASYVYQKTLAMNFTYIIILIVLIYNAIYMNRAMLLIPLRDIIYILFFNYLFRKIIK